MTLAVRPSSVSPHRSPHPPASAPLTFKQEILDCQVRVGCGLIIIVGICDVVWPVLIVILFVLYRTVMYVVIVTKNIEIMIRRSDAYTAPGI